MKMLRSAMIAGFCVAAAAVTNANAAVVGFSDTISQGVTKTYTVLFGPDLTVINGTTPYIQTETITHTFDYIPNPEGNGGHFESDPFQLLSVCAGLFDCTRLGQSLSGDVPLTVVTVGNKMTITVTNNTHSFDDCAPGNYKHCAGTGGPTTISTGFRFDNSEPEFSYTVQQGGVPEPATWGLMILGFGMVGAAYRRTGALARV